jgi:hypothetical protein
VHVKRLIFGLGVAISASAAAVACSSSSTPASSSPGEDAAAPDSTTPDTGATTTEPDSGSTAPDSGSTTTVPDSGSAAPDSGSTTTDGGVACNPGATLYDRLGGYDGIHSALVAIVGQELANPDIASYFYNQVASPIPAGHPTAGQIEDCFAVLLSSVAGGPYSYPPDGGVVGTDGGTFACRDMATIHQPLMISGGSFDEFVSIAAATLAPTVCATDLATIGGALESTKSAIVLPSLADAGLQPFPGTVDSGTEQ